MIFNGKAAALPAGEPSGERADARDALPSQKQRHTGAGGFVRSSAVEDDVAVAKNFLLAFLELVGVEAERAGNRQRVSVEFH